jgi:hypothetical protein
MEVELPPFCFLSEAIDWIAFGRVPQMQHEVERHTDEVIDYRFYWQEMPDNFQPSFEYPWFDRLEFESLGIPLDEAYFEAAEVCFVEDATRLENRIADYESKEKVLVEEEDGSIFDVYEKLAFDTRQTLDNVRIQLALVERVEARFKPFRDIACAKLFQLLALEQVKCQAINLARWERLADDDKYQEAAQFEDIPANAFTLGMDWLSNEIVVNDEKYVAIRIDTQDILDNRSTLLQTGKPIVVQRFGAFYTSSSSGRTNRRSKVGRRSLIDWLKLKEYFAELVRAGNLPDGKESCIYELISYAERELGSGPIDFRSVA